MKRTEKIISLLAVLSLVAALVIGIVLQEERDYHSELAALVPDAEELVKCSSEPLIYQVLATRDGQRVPVGYVGIGSAVGYEGPVYSAVVCDLEGNITGVAVVEHKEWMTWYRKVEKAGFIDAFVDRRVTEALTVGNDIDAISTATFTSVGIAHGIRQAAHAVASSQLKLPVAPTGERLEVTIDVLIVLGIWVLAFAGVALKQNKLRWVTMLVSLGVIGFWLASPVSFSTISGLLMGRVPPFDTAHLLWYLMVTGVIATVLVFGRNIYCYWICPFGALHELLAAAGGGGLKPGQRVGRILRLLRPALVWAALVITFVTRSMQAGDYVPFGTLFTFTGSGVRWILLILVLLVGIISQRFWCLYLCPVGYSVDLMASWRRKARRFLIDWRSRGKRAPADTPAETPSAAATGD